MLTPSDPDQLTSHRSIYDASGWEIFWRNFLAGIARGLGMFIFNIIFFVILANLFMQLLYPMVAPLLESFTSLNSLMEQVNSLNK